ncbi:alpha/beta fold hydrolase [Streptomyces thermolilacinus]|uniref:alpha/beta fold hydrolase n=1 Tax=Streptomyces thermolilacinus TaxID=285540 RepID=UPI0003C76499|nr:alpha/beta hydrolase [Streptomyces thermolilacinus]
MLTYERRGSGPVVVLVPGLGATRDFFAPVAAGLGRDHTVVAVDLPGHGATALRDGAEPTLRDAAAGLRAVVEKLGLSDIALVGWSLGATVAWTYLEEYGPQGVRGLVSCEQTPWLLADGGWEYAAFGSLDAAAAKDLLEQVRQDPGGFAENLVRGSFATGSEPDPELADDLVRKARRTAPAALTGLLADVLRQDWRERVGALGVPTLLVHGARSGVYPPEVGTWLAKTVPGSRLELLEHSGHLCFLEEPDRFCAAVRGFLASTRNDTASARHDTASARQSTPSSRHDTNGR